jgi:hypothetical protein
MYPILNLKKNLIAGLVLSGSVAVATAASSLTKSGLEYPMVNSMPRDQVFPHLSLGVNGGYIVTQDPSVDGNGSGIRGRRIYSDLSAFRSSFQVNSITPGDQQNARVAVFPASGAAFAWQSSTGTGNRIYVRFLSESGTFTGPEFPASETAVSHQSDVALAVLKDGSLVVVWAEDRRDGNMQGIFAQRFTSAGTRIGSTFQVNTVTYLNQRNPTVAALADGGFVVAWVSEEFRRRNSEYVDITARIYNAQGAAAGPEVALNTGERICANPNVVATASGFRAAWSSRQIDAPTFVSANADGTQTVRTLAASSPESWDVTTRLFNLQAVPAGVESIVNNTRHGDQFSPRMINYGARELILWTSFGQDHSDEGIYGRVVSGVSDFEGDEFLVNTVTAFKQIQPTVSLIDDKIVVAWSSFIGAAEGFDIRAQQYTISGDAALPVPTAPFVSSLSQKSILATWAEVVSQPVDRYRIYIDNETTPVESTSGMVVITRDNWTPGSTHTVRLSYRLQDGRVSPVSEPVTIVTWGADENSDGIPDDWQRENWGKVWPLASADSDGDGASNLAEFLAGTDPTSAVSVLNVQISPREQGVYLQWPTNPGNYYQVQITSDFVSWSDVGTPRFAPSTSDAVPMESTGHTQYYRVIRMR